ncbi:hypothetical protein [Mycetocola reblochoni]|uniref:hypothetical protein n=1 Tax=Mycetocola reblochoni TaxID=331618 RepID=UPI003F9BB8D0
MPDQTGDYLPIFGAVPSAAPRYGEGPLETSVRAEIEAANAAEPFDSARKMTSQICLALAQNIDAGNRKGRAIANEATQLALLLDQLRGDTTDTDSDESIPADVRDLFALAALPGVDGSAALRDEEEPS